ncbi:hypothetical protein NT01EI_3415 [Edwardsiella ictaluri 93-146]|uniref:Uncharacterized protein n=1 Tax=Edwardsiella ictaluri (strain 93-146) TaxID=634503 RepID=C5BBU5_EDWI9|nr:hypothetical protein NT01EI_3415 [Edwardsiella ictaluri 93-146]
MALLLFVPLGESLFYLTVACIAVASACRRAPTARPFGCAVG